MRENLESEALAWLGNFWLFVGAIKPNRTIDELARFASDIYHLDDPQSAAVEPELEGQLAAAQKARQAVAASGADPRAMAVASERVAVVNELLTPGVVPRDPLTGSLNLRRAGDAVTADTPAYLRPIQEHGGGLRSGLHAVVAASADADTAGSARQRGREARARLAGERSALRRVGAAIPARRTAAAVGATSEVVHARLEAVEAAAATLSASPRRRGGPATRGATLGAAAATRAAGPAVRSGLAAARSAKRRIDISTGRDTRDRQ